MAHYIDKDALVVEIERLKTIYNDDENIHHVAKYNILVDILSFINTLEVKEVDFEKAFAALIDHFDEKNNYGQWPESDLRNFAEHFFELGIQQSKNDNNNEEKK